MSFEITGKLIEKFDTQKISESFQKREFVIETSDDKGDRTFTEQIKFQLTQDRCSLIDNYSVNDQVKLNFDIKGRRWEKEGRVNYFTNLEAWRIEAAGGNKAAAPAPANNMPEPAPFPEDTGADDLPF